MRKNDLIIGAALFLLPFLFFLPGTIHYLAISDSFIELHVYTKYLFDEFQAGRDPLWMPYLLGGFSIVADPLQNFYQPLNWLFAFLPEVIAMNLLIVLTYSLGLVFTYAFTRSSLGYSYAAATLSAASYIFGGYVFGWFICAPTMIVSAVWIPLTL